jgi:hypothetical protein
MLDHLHSFLRAKGFETHLVQAGESAPMDQIVIRLEADEKGRERSLWLTPLPHLEEDFENGISLLQLLATLPVQSTMETESELARKIIQLNNKLTLGGFGFSQPDGVVFCRHVLVLGPDDSINGAIVSETIVLMNFLLDQFGNAVEDVATD